MNTFENAFIFHGTAGSPEGNWFPWLKHELESRGTPTFVPRFPTPEGESLNAWLEVLDALPAKITSSSLLIGHSKGGMFLLKVLERVKDPVSIATFIGAPVGEKPIRFYEEDKIFSNFDFEWTNIRHKAKKFIVFHSDNDPYVSIGNGQRLSQELGTELTFIPNAGHFNQESGYTSFPELLAKLEI